MISNHDSSIVYLYGGADNSGVKGTLHGYDVIGNCYRLVEINGWE
jgi:hypothetical protein